jgi:methionyl-tRNA synthetase
MHTHLVTATPPTPNGDLHVGHLSGPFLAADVYTRYRRLRGDRAVYLCSSDDHQSYVMTTAARLGRDPAELAAQYAGTIQQTLEAARIRVDRFTRALGNPAHVRAVQAFFRDLWDRGVLTAGRRPALHCAACDRYLFESFAKGTCPDCGEAAAGNLCEACGRVGDPVALLQARCGFCGRPADLSEYSGIFFPLERWREPLERFYAERTSWRPHLGALCEALLSRPLPQYPVSYPSPWGIRVPVEGFGDQAINVWLEMFPGHVETTRAWAEGVGEPPDTADRLWGGDATVVQFLGYDNSFFNAVLHVAAALASEGRYAPAEHIVTNEFYLLDGAKFSTSRGHAVWGAEILSAVEPDGLRWHLARTNPEHTQTNFTFRSYAARVEAELGGWNATLGRAFRLFEEAGGAVPAAAEPDLDARGVLGLCLQRLERTYDVHGFSLRQASATLEDLREGIHRYAERTELLAGDSLHLRRLASLGWLLRGLSIAAAPLLPDFSGRLAVALGEDAAPAHWEHAARPRGNATRSRAPETWFRPLPTLRATRSPELTHV